MLTCLKGGGIQQWYACKLEDKQHIEEKLSPGGKKRSSREGGGWGRKEEARPLLCAEVREGKTKKYERRAYCLSTVM